MKNLFFLKIVILFLLSIDLYGQVDSTTSKKTYSFIIIDSPAKLFSMRQVDNNYISILRGFNTTINNSVSSKFLSNLIQFGFVFIFMPMTHEEGHRSILTANDIGSISQPFFNSQGAAFVIGVKDNTLENLRNNSLPDYIRLHTAGIESDYMLTRRVETLVAFENEEFKNLRWEYWYRKFAIIQYAVTGLLKFDLNIEEDPDELKRDIVGHDIYGFARHLYRPTMEFYRYTKYADLSDSEIDLVTRVGRRSFLNLLNPIILGKKNFEISSSIKANFGLGYALAPFGDFIDENIWAQFNTSYDVHFYGRQFENASNWFWGFGISLNNYIVSEKLSLTLATHYWVQPEDLDFFTSNSFSGGAVDLEIGYNIFRNNDAWVKGFGLVLGGIYKTFGFLPEEIILDEHLGLRLGVNFEF